MRLKRGLLGESPEANSTLKWPETRVNMEMASQIARRRKTARAQHTLVWFNLHEIRNGIYFNFFEAKSANRYLYYVIL